MKRSLRHKAPAALVLSSLLLALPSCGGGDADADADVDNDAIGNPLVASLDNDADGLPDLIQAYDYSCWD